MNGRSKPVNKVRRWGSLLRTDTWVLPFFSRYKRVLGLSLLLGVAAAACSSALMFASGYLISASAERPLEGIFALFTPLALVQIFGIGKPFAAYFERLYSHDWVLRMTSELRLRLYRAFESSPSGRGVGEVLGLLAQDVAHIQDLYLRSVFPTVVALVLWVGMALLFGFFTWWFGLAMLLLVGVCVLLVPLVSVLVNCARRLRADSLSAELYASAADDVLGVGDCVGGILWGALWARAAPSKRPSKPWSGSTGAATFSSRCCWGRLPRSLPSGRLGALAPRPKTRGPMGGRGIGSRLLSWDFFR